MLDPSNSSPLPALAIGGYAVLAGSLPFLLALRSRVASPEARRHQLPGWLSFLAGACAGTLVFLAGAWVETIAGATSGVQGRIVGMILCAALGGLVGVIAGRHHWHIAGATAYGGLVLGSVGFVGTTAQQAFVQQGGALAFAMLVLVAQAGAMSMITLYAFYSVDAIARRSWNRVAPPPPYKGKFPPIAIHVACFNEPVELVIACLESALAQEYPARTMIVCVDDSTDTGNRAELSKYCNQHGIVYLHRPDRRGYKAGALNDALKATPAKFGFVALLDADFQARPDFLRRLAPHLQDDSVAFAQARQSHRNVNESFVTRLNAVQEDYFYRCVMPSRNEADAIILCGTMAVIRRAALDDAGGWREGHISEDTELSLRMLAKGWRSIYVDEPLGSMLLPSTFEHYRRQQYRWAFGGVKIIKHSLRRLAAPGLTFRQKLDYAVGALHWFDGVYVLALSTALLLIAAADLGGYQITGTLHAVGLLLLVPLVILADGLVRLHVTFRRMGRASLAETLKVLALWCAIKLNNTRAAVRALSPTSVPFDRTPKGLSFSLTRTKAVGRAVSTNGPESMLALVLTGASIAITLECLHAATFSRVVLAFWLAYYGLFFAAAPICSYVTNRSLPPPGSILDVTRSSRQPQAQ